MFVRNQAQIDRIIRVVAGVALTALAAVTSQWLLAIPGVILLVTGLLGFCPLYRILGFSTCSVDYSKRG